jgi:hypothetical protein
MPVANEVVLTREDLLKLMPEEDADELLADARGDAAPGMTMTAEEFERWMVDGPDRPFTPSAKR